MIFVAAHDAVSGFEFAHAVGLPLGGKDRAVVNDWSALARMSAGIIILHPSARDRADFVEVWRLANAAVERGATMAIVQS